MHSIKQRLTTGAIWLAATRVLVNLLGFASTLLLARLLTPADFGLVAIATTVTTIIASVTELSLASALIQHQDPSEDHYHTAWTLNTCRAGLMGLLLAALALPIAHLYRDDRLIAIMLVLAATTLAGGLINPKVILFSRNLVFWQEFAIGVSQKLVGLIAAALVVIITRSYWALIVGSVAAQATALLVSYWLTPYRPRVRLTRARELLSFSVWLTLAQIANTINYKFDQLVIGYFLGSALLGSYTVGDQLAVMPTREAMLPLAQTLFPGFVKLAHDQPRLRQAYQRAQAFLSAVGMPVGFGFAALARPLILLTMGTKWLGAVVIIQIFACVFALQTIVAPVQPLAMALGETRGLCKRDYFLLLVRLPLMVIGLYAGGLIGIVCARCVSGMVANWINLTLVRRMLGLAVREQILINMRSLIGTLLMAASMIVVTAFFTGGSAPLFATEIAVEIAVGGIVYVAGVYTLWRLAGRPSGPEQEVIRIAVRYLPRRNVGIS